MVPPDAADGFVTSKAVECSAAVDEVQRYLSSLMFRALSSLEENGQLCTLTEKDLRDCP